MVQLAAMCARCSDNQRALGHGSRNGIVFDRVFENRARAYRGLRFMKSDMIRIDQTQVRKSKVAHRPRRGADIEWITRRHQNDTEIAGSFRCQAVPSTRTHATEPGPPRLCTKPSSASLICRAAA